MFKGRFNISKQNLLHYSKILIVLLVVGYVQIVYVDSSEVPLYENGQPKSYGTYENGLPEGKWTWWFEDGEKMSEGFFNNGKRNGKWTTWFAGGQEKSRGMYKDDKLEGIFHKWHSNGIIAFEGRYVADKLDGTQKYYDKAGKLKKTEQYSMGVLE